MFSGLHAGVIPHTDLIIFPIGILAAAISGFLCIRFLLDYLQSNNMNVFVFYRWVLALLIIVVALLGG